MTPTVHNNLLAGPTADAVEDREAVNTTAEGLAELLEKAGLNVKNLPVRKIILLVRKSVSVHIPWHLRIR